MMMTKSTPGFPAEVKRTAGVMAIAITAPITMAIAMAAGITAMAISMGANGAVTAALREEHMMIDTKTGFSLVTV